MVVTGVLLFYAIPVRSYQNIFFRIKVIFLILAGLNAFIFHTGIYQRRVERGTATRRRRAQRRFAGAASLVLWAVIIVAGRMIAYNWFDCDKPQSRWSRSRPAARPRRRSDRGA